MLYPSTGQAMPDQLLTIGEVARRAGYHFSPALLRRIRPAPTIVRISGQRRYLESAISLVGIILLLRDVEFTLADQKAFMTSRAVAPGDWQRLARRKLAELDDQIPRPRPSARPLITRCAACTKTSSNAPTSPASSPPAPPANLWCRKSVPYATWA